MIIFDRLQISDNGKMLYIDAHVNKADYFDNNYIDYIVIKTADQVSEATTLSSDDTYIYRRSVEANTREIHLALQPTDMNEYFSKSDFSSDLFFVYIVCGGTVASCTPCRLDELTTLGVTFDYGNFYNKVMNYTRELANTCNIPTNFINLILNFSAFKAAVETEHFGDAIKFYKQLFDLSGSSSSTKGCGCHG